MLNQGYQNGRCQVSSIAARSKGNLEELSKSLTQDTQDRILHHLRKLCPFLDETGTIRLKGRLRLSGLSPQVKHPIWLSSEHPFVMMLRKAHEDKYLEGTEFVRSILQQEVWISGLRHALRRIKHKCAKRRKNAAQSTQVEMADLLKERMDGTSYPFQNGMDSFGPFEVRVLQKTMK